MDHTISPVQLVSTNPFFLGEGIKKIEAAEAEKGVLECYNCPFILYMTVPAQTLLLV